MCDVYAPLLTGSVQLITVKKHAKHDMGFVGSGVTFCAVFLETFGGLSTEGMALFKTVIGRTSRVAPHCARTVQGLVLATSQLQLTALRGESGAGEDTEVR